MKRGLYETLERIATTINERKGGDPAKSYVAQLFAKGDDAMLKKIGEEATETALTGRSGEPGFASFITDIFQDMKSTRLKTSNVEIMYSDFCLKKKKSSA